MTTDFRTLCAELVAAFNSYHLFMDAETTTASQRAERVNQAIASAVAALKAESVGEGPTDQDVLQELIDVADDALLSDHPGDVVRAGRRLLARWGRPAAPPLPEPGEVGELVNSLTLISDGMNALNHEADSWVVARSAALLQRQESELAALRGVAVAGISDEHRDAVHTAIAEALGGRAYDCLRVWEAWNVGTMGPDDFTLTAEDDDRVAEIADAAIDAFRTFQVPAPQAGEREA